MQQLIDAIGKGVSEGGFAGCWDPVEEDARRGLVRVQVSFRWANAYPATPTRKRPPSGRLQFVSSVSSTGIGVGVWRVGGDSRLISGDYHSGDLIDMPLHVAKSD
jgi:hypothetical protein